MYGIPAEVIEGVIARRGRVHALERLDARTSALVVIDLQNYFMKPGFAAEVAAARDIVPAVNRAAGAMRARGAPVVWVQTDSRGADREWPFLHDALLTPAASARRLEGLAPGSEGHALWPALDVQRTDLVVAKNRYSAFVQGASPLPDILRRRGVDTVLIAGTATNV